MVLVFLTLQTSVVHSNKIKPNTGKERKGKEDHTAQQRICYVLVLTLWPVLLAGKVLYLARGWLPFECSHWSSHHPLYSARLRDGEVLQEKGRESISTLCFPFWPHSTLN